ncbi:transcription factor bHLH62-like protein [Corchorus capsularis]|uniref:Transcription factor bHLH62-like protein n=1 Tax=Corchorus capsularis TaxID=210143 RepID=A0A1R3INQ2_COCAP|nr:transcription factor bHLH62-like protein [Corchorus capsularis]
MNQSQIVGCLFFGFRLHDGIRFWERVVRREEGEQGIARWSFCHSSDKKSSLLSRSSSPENAEFRDSKEESSVSEQISCVDSSTKVQNDANAKVMASPTANQFPGAKETPSPTAAGAKDSRLHAATYSVNIQNVVAKNINADFGCVYGYGGVSMVVEVLTDKITRSFAAEGGSEGLCRKDNRYLLSYGQVQM